MPLQENVILALSIIKVTKKNIESYVAFVKSVCMFFNDNKLMPQIHIICDTTRVYTKSTTTIVSNKSQLET